jgi:hypothetical protein
MFASPYQAVLQLPKGQAPHCELLICHRASFNDTQVRSKSTEATDPSTHQRSRATTSSQYMIHTKYRSIMCVKAQELGVCNLRAYLTD